MRRLCALVNVARSSPLERKQQPRVAPTGHLAGGFLFYCLIGGIVEVRAPIGSTRLRSMAVLPLYEVGCGRGRSRTRTSAGGSCGLVRNPPAAVLAFRLLLGEAKAMQCRRTYARQREEGPGGQTSLTPRGTCQREVLLTTRRGFEKFASSLAGHVYAAVRERRQVVVTILTRKLS